MKKLAVVTLYDDINIGNKLQNYAVQQFFSNMGFDVYTIPHWEMAHQKFSISILKKWFVEITGMPHERAKKIKLERKRKKKFKAFSDKYLNLGTMVKMKEISEDLSKKYDYFVTGSDQVWHNWTKSSQEIDYFFLRFANMYQRLSIAPSFGKERIEDQFIERYKEGLEGIPFITCREKQGAEIIWKLTQKKALVILDPTMLISTDEWIRIEKKPKAYTDEKYILVYFLGSASENMRMFIKKISQKYKLKVVDIYNTKVDYLYSTTPDEFIYYIRHAEFVVTDSFHATVFSILFKRNFAVFDRKTESMGNMTSRLDTLLEKFDLLDRKYKNLDFTNLFMANFSKVNIILETERKKTYEYYLDVFAKLDDMKVKNQEGESLK